MHGFSLCPGRRPLLSHLFSSFKTKGSDNVRLTEESKQVRAEPEGSHFKPTLGAFPGDSYPQHPQRVVPLRTPQFIFHPARGGRPVIFSLNISRWPFGETPPATPPAWPQVIGPAPLSAFCRSRCRGRRGSLAPVSTVTVPGVGESTPRSRDHHVREAALSLGTKEKRMGTLHPLQLRLEDGRHVQGPFTWIELLRRRCGEGV